MDNLTKIEEPQICYCGQGLRFSDIELQKLGETTFTQNKNYVAVLKKNT